ncbi:MAG: hypothetical protein CL693_22060 [Cellvibrionaceae bacterium]|jgi:hypothetical protein|nr:hypothetical protein [Cellvibrionaceae bacterium]|tara:strand:+ start:3688 stop:3993 length:306 start_codon:yes stop_codon:yes gene_type:complete
MCRVNKLILDTLVVPVPADPKLSSIAEWVSMSDGWRAIVSKINRSGVPGDAGNEWLEHISAQASAFIPEACAALGYGVVTDGRLQAQFFQRYEEMVCGLWA